MKTFRTPVDGPLALKVTGTSAELSVKTTPDMSEAIVEVAGPIDVLERAVARREGSRWVITLPAGSSSATTHVSRGGSVHNRAGNVSGGAMLIQAGNISGGIDMSGNGPFTVQSGANVSQSTPIRITALLPEGADLTGRVGGEVSLMGRLGRVDVSTESGDVAVNHASEVTADTESGDINVFTPLEEVDVSTESGDITVHKSAPRTRARTGSGDITIDAAGDHRIRARTGSGAITVHRGGHHPDVDARTGSGNERVI